MSAISARRTEAITTVVMSSRVGGEMMLGSPAGVAAAPAARRRPRRPGAATVRPGLLRRVVKVRNLPEEIEAVVNLLSRGALQPLGAEAFHGEGAHHAAIEHRAAKHRGRQ